MGTIFYPLQDEVNLFNIHGEMSEAIGEKVTINGVANYYNYSYGSRICLEQARLGWETGFKI